VPTQEKPTFAAIGLCDDKKVQLERHRASRYPFQANVELTDVRLETQITGRTSDLSLFGCHVNTLKP
jgi:hypothetical protein